ncbi:(2Fe-2S)-binding protein [Ferruginibacter sp. SUN106]|uniref:(2Fe-2S)-binding protein n=1 Tax=Ferruginibacter sp. SUN106 TaxID=2978348 RepID=UPI003D3634C0
MPAFKLTVNNAAYTVDAESDMPLLWVLRDLLNLTGTKYGCGVASCGACTVMIDGNAAYACQRPVGSCVNKKIITIEGLSADGSHPVQKAWQKAGVPQCGYCQPGQMMAAAAMLEKNKKPSDETIAETMSSNLCRCGTYHRIKEAIHIAIEDINK